MVGRHKCPRVLNLDTLSDEAVGHGVVVPVAAEVEMAVVGHLQGRVAAYLERLGVERPEPGLVGGQEAFLAGAGDLRHALGVERRHLLLYRVVELVLRVERRVPEGREHVAVDQLDHVLHKRLVFRLVGAAGHRGAAVVVAEVLHHPADLRLVAVGLGDGGLEVVGDDDAGYTADVTQAALQGEEEVLDTLGADGHGEAVVRGRERGDEHLHGNHLAARHVNIRHRVAGEIHVKLASTLAALRHDEGQGGGLAVLADVEAELRVAVVVAHLQAVFLPELVKGEVALRAGQLAHNVVQTSAEFIETPVGSGQLAAVHATLQHRVVERQQLFH